ncbi:hypothetical protein HDA32_001442 [Spinactinospora alkalitolerans]|uniref:(2Fe-2S) ferredoxin domain-containing protein n=1 Tax=Spinactinospora alkalitolerans TaxID=687207 RepID=A0A852TTY8_9ACTN|nr:(2Fe-2S) ferredoxin domain-containing protein [Spinactinospora alkalitolerans]NYE46322.1 hypothetical protein [Spinactinospora alkalitolerans]
MVTPSGGPCRLVVCRGCCCGTKKKRPGVDHKGQLARLSALGDHEGRAVPVRLSTCLGICFKANVVVVQPSSAGRAAGGRPVWLGDFTEDRLIDDLDDWIFAGGPGIAPLPTTLEPHLTGKDAKKPKKDKKDKKAEKEKKKAKKDKKEQKVDRPEKKKDRRDGPTGKGAKEKSGKKKKSKK